MKKMIFVAIVTCWVIAPMLSEAQDSTKAKRTEMRKAFREKWQNATPEQKEKGKSKRKNERSQS